MSKDKKTNRNSQEVRGKARKQGHCALFTIHCSLLIVLCYLFVNCPNSVVSPPGNQTPLAPEGMGYFLLSVNGDNVARTLLPTEPEFKTYKLEFEPASGNVNSSVEYVVPKADMEPGYEVLLYSGTWNLWVGAYTDEVNDPDEVPKDLAAEGELTVVIDAATVSATVELFALEEGKGDFTYTIAYPSVDSAEMTITSMADGSVKTIIIPASGESDTITLDAGFYEIEIELTDSEGKKAFWSETLRVKPNMESLFTHTFTEINFFAELSGEVYITGTPWVGGSLFVNIDDLAGDRTVYYNWYKSGTPDDFFLSDKPFYTVSNADDGDDIYVEVTRMGYNGSKKSDPMTINAVPYPYIITGSGTQFIAMLGGRTVAENQSIQNVINAIKTDANSEPCEIQFGNGGADLDVGTASVGFNITGGSWGKITLLGSITGQNAVTDSAVIVIGNSVLIDIKCKKIENTGDGGNALRNTNGSTITLSIIGAEVSATSGYAIHNVSSGRIEISDSTVSATTGTAIHNNSGRIIISGTDTLITSANPDPDQGTIHFVTGGTSDGYWLEINGSTVQNTSSGNAIRNTSARRTLVNGGTVSAETGVAIYGSSLTVESGKVSATTGTAVFINSLIMNGGEISATTTGTAIFSRSGPITISGGRVEAETGRAIHKEDTGLITVEGTALITSANPDTDQGTIHFTNIGGNTSVRLTMNGGEVHNTASNGTAIRNDSPGGITINAGTVSATPPATAYAVNSTGTGALNIDWVNADIIGRTNP